MKWAEDQIIPYRVGDLPAGPWLVFAPHADDETLGMGGALLQAAAQGVETHLVVMTDGAMGGMDEDLVDRRVSEVGEAAALLGIARVRHLKQPDRGLQCSSVLEDRVVNLIRSSAPAAVFFPGLFEPHPDHRATALLVWKGLLALPEAMRPLALSYEITVQSPVNLLVDVTREWAAKQRTIRVYHSQLQENAYLELCEALNRLRSFSVGGAGFYEGFYQFSRQELLEGPEHWLCHRLLCLIAC